MFSYFGSLQVLTGKGNSANCLRVDVVKFCSIFLTILTVFRFEATKQIRSMEMKVNDLLESGEASPEMYGNVLHWHIPILAMTADVFQATHDECLRCGMDGYVSKPFEEEQLYSAVAHFIQADPTEPVS